ncbi:hypothetical protein [Paenisporosarcina quisquiliarum]|uniref:hypothetical protein n=1 Tax=Paenisporosarcina quisquiliarum TaxID=365346 RepID=UPI0037369417
MTKYEYLTAITIGTLYSFSISSVISSIGNLMFSEFISFPFFLLMTVIPSIGAFGILLYLKIRKGNLGYLFSSLILGFCISFFSMFIALFLDNMFKEEIYWSLLDVESFIWFIAFAMIGTILFIPISFVFIKISLKYFSISNV